MKDSQIAPLLTPILEQFALDLETVDIVPAGKRRLLRVVVDGDGPTGDGPLLDDIAEATRAISTALDESDATGNSPYTLEVSSRGVSRPLTLPRHWRRNAGRLVRVKLNHDNDPFTGRILDSGEDSAEVEVDNATRTISFADVSEALIQVEMNRKQAAGDDEENED